MNIGITQRNSNIAFFHTFNYFIITIVCNVHEQHILENPKITSVPIVQRKVLNNDKLEQQSKEHEIESTANNKPGIATNPKNNTYLGILNEKDYTKLTRENKLKRLKDLRTEVKRLVAQLKEERHSFDKQRKSKNKNANRIRSRKWKRRIRQKLRLITKRLTRLEKQTQENNPKPLKKPAYHNDTKATRKRLNKDYKITKNSTPHTLFQQTRDKLKLGDNGSKCNTHKDCKPGLCCHRILANSKPSQQYSLNGDNQTVNLPIIKISQCVLYEYEEGTLCKHSCACKAQLHCFRDTKSAASTIKPGSTAMCKKASANDLMTGLYENSKETFFMNDDS